MIVRQYYKFFVVRNIIFHSCAFEDSLKRNQPANASEVVKFNDDVEILSDIHVA